MLLTNDSTVTAEYATRHDGYLTIYEHVTYTRCQTCVNSDGTPLMGDQVAAKRRTMSARPIIYHEDATFVVRRHAIITVPHFSQPDPTVKRRTGVLMPELSFKGLYGVGVEVPYFINLAPNYDITLMPMITTKQGLLAHGEWRHRLDERPLQYRFGGHLSARSAEPGQRR